MAEVAGLVLFERLFATRVRRENLVVWVFFDVKGVLFVDAFEIDDAGLAVFVGTFDDVSPQLLGRNRQFFANLDVLAKPVELVDLFGFGGGDVWLLGAWVRKRERSSPPV